MNLTFSLMGVELFSVSLSLPRLGVYALDSLPDSDEAIATWVREVDEED